MKICINDINGNVILLIWRIKIIIVVMIIYEKYDM